MTVLRTGYGAEGKPSLHPLDGAMNLPVEKYSHEVRAFFVKNLENVQGDEDDVISISTTFGPPPGLAKVRQNFGPISRPEGWRRLYVRR